MLVGAFTRGPNDATEQLYANSQDHKQVREMFLLIQKIKQIVMDHFGQIETKQLEVWMFKTHKLLDMPWLHIHLVNVESI